MDRKQFMKELSERLKRLPQEEKEEALNYYEEYFDEAGLENEAATIAALGSPTMVASKIIGEFAIKDVKKEKRQGTNPLWIALLAALALPLGAPLMITAIVLILALGLVVFSLVLVGISVTGAGVVALFVGFWSFTYGFATGLFYLGMGMVVMAIGLALAGAINLLLSLLYRFMQQGLGKVLIRRGNQ